MRPGSEASTLDGNMHACIECGKQFPSKRALFGHMRCHPSRPWRGSRPLDAAKGKEGVIQTSSADRQVTGLPRKEASSCKLKATSQQSISRSEAEARGAVEHTGCCTAEAAAPDNESDTESIEAIYKRNWEQPLSDSGLIRNTIGLSTKRYPKHSRRQLGNTTVRYFQNVTKTTPSPLITQTENEVRDKAANVLMMLSRNPTELERRQGNWLDRRSSKVEPAPRGIQENGAFEIEEDGPFRKFGNCSDYLLQHGTKTTEVPLIPRVEKMSEAEQGIAMTLASMSLKVSKEWKLVPKEIQELASSKTQGDDLGKQNDNKYVGDGDEGELMEKSDLVYTKNNKKGKADVEVTNSAMPSLCEEYEVWQGDGYEASERRVGSTRPKYFCNTCKRDFKSHQGLGGHRASHKNVRGCYARTEDLQILQKNPDEQTLSLEFPRSESSDGQLTINHELSKRKRHLCTICGCGFDSGPALGGHKRCHYIYNDKTREVVSGPFPVNLVLTLECGATNLLLSNRQPTLASQLQLQGGGGHGKVLEDKILQERRSYQDQKRRSYEDQQNHNLDQCDKEDRSASEELIKPTTQIRAVKKPLWDLNLPASFNDDDMGGA